MPHRRLKWKIPARRPRPVIVSALVIVLLSLVFLSACDEQPPPLAPFYPYPPIEDNGIFTSSPTSPTAAQRYVGTHDRTYIGFYSSTGSGNGLIEIKYWDEDDKTLSDSVTLWSGWGYDSSGLGPGDDHASPSVLVLQYQSGNNAIHNGKILVAAAEHCCSAENKGRCQTRRSVNSEDISAWESPVLLESVNATYTRLEELNNGTVYLFYRLSHTAPKARSTFYYRTSTDAGATWSARTLLADTDVTDEGLYLLTCTNPEHTQIHCMFNRTGIDDPLPGQQRYQDIYHIYYDLLSDKWKKMDGTEVTVPLSISELDLVYSTDEGLDPIQDADWTFLWDIKTDDSGNPYLVSVTIDEWGAFEIGEGKTPELDCIVCRHNYDNGWQTEGVSLGGSGQFGTYTYPAGAVLDDSDVDIIYLTPYDANKRTQLQKWQRIDGLWIKVEDITQSSPGWNFRPIAVRNGAGNLRVLWCYAERYSHFGPGYWESMIFAYPGHPGYEH